MQRLYYSLLLARGAALVHSKSSNVVSIWTRNNVVGAKGFLVVGNHYSFHKNSSPALFDGSLDGANIDSFIGNSIGQWRTGYGVVPGIKSRIQRHRLGVSVGI
jgi:hypothetical protein